MQTTKTQIKTSKALTELLNNDIWRGILDSFHGKENCKILNIATTNKDTDYLIANKYNVTQVSPNNIKDIETNNQFDIAIVTYLNKQIKEEFERENLLYEISERMHPSGYIFLSLTKSSQIKLGSDIIIENKDFVTYLI